MTNETEFLFEVLTNEVERQNLRLHSLVTRGRISEGEYNHITSNLKNNVDFTPKYDLVVRICDGLGLTPNELIKDMKDENDKYYTSLQKRHLDAVKGYSETEMNQINLMLRMIAYGLKKSDKQK